MKYKRLFSILFVFTVTAIIFNFSLKNADISNAQSGLFVNIAQQILVHFPSIQIDVDTLTHIIRKLAHFSEYGGLGISIALVLLSYPKTNKLSYLWILYGVLVPIIDECIQYFVPGRSCQISDMLLDMSGCACGLVICLLISNLFLRKNNCKA